VYRRFVCAVGSSNVLAAAGPTLFRSYRVSKNNTYNCEIWEAGRATSAASKFFERIKIGPANSGVDYFDASFGYNNPIDQVIDEAELIFGADRKVACIVSIGAGETGEAKYSKPVTFQRRRPTALIDVLQKISTNSEATAERFERRLARIPGMYQRLNVNLGLKDVELEEWKKFGEVREHTQNYMKLESVSLKIDKIVEILTDFTSDSSEGYDIMRLGNRAPRNLPKQTRLQGSA
jgi:hypothetical protein